MDGVGSVAHWRPASRHWQARWPCAGALRKRWLLVVPFRQVPRVAVDSPAQLFEALHVISAMAARVYPGRLIVYRGQHTEYYVNRSPEERRWLFDAPDCIEFSIQPSEARRGMFSDAARAIWAMLVQRRVAETDEYNPPHESVLSGRSWPLPLPMAGFLR